MGSEIRAKKDFLAKLVPLLEQGGCYGDALYLREESLGVNKDNSSTDIGRQTDEGVKLRVFDGERWHERGLSGWNGEALQQAAKALGKHKEKRTRVRLELPKEPLDADYKALGEQDPATVRLTKKIATVKAIHARFLDLSKRLVNARIYYEEMRETKVFANRHRKLSQEISGCLIILVAFIKSDEGDIRYHFKSFYDHGWECVAVTDKELKEINRFSEKVARAEKLAPGKYHCLLTPQMTGLLAHESFGHGMEADTILKGRAQAKEWLGKRIASTKVSIADGPLEKGAHGFFFFDDEGWLATKTLMVDKGVVNRPLTDAYSAARLGVPRSSNGRAESFDHKVYARMTNTFFEPGPDAKRDMLARIEDGLILHNASGGMEDPKGWGIQIQGVIAERVKNGRPTGKLYYEIGMTGYLPTMLKNIQAVSKEFSLPGTGRCGKGHHDWVRVAEGGPWLLVKDVILS